MEIFWKCFVFNLEMDGVYVWPEKVETFVIVYFYFMRVLLFYFEYIWKSIKIILTFQVEFGNKDIKCR